MARDPLLALVRVRRIALDASRRTLAQCLEAEDKAARARVEVEAAITAERLLAESLEGADSAVEAYAAWLPAARERLRAAVAAQERVAAETARARAAVMVARRTCEAAEDAQARWLAGERAARLRKEQAVLDDFSSQVRKG
jgi:hypothetical protein